MRGQTSKLEIVFIGIGSNLGDRQKFISSAISQILKTPSVSLVKLSSIIETLPEGNIKQNKFLNAVIEVSTSLSPHKLLLILQKIEKTMGRKRSKKNAPRIIDLDILLYGERVIKQKDLTVPHPRMFSRYFVLKPLLEISPHILDNHPLLRPFKQKILSIIHSA